MSNFADIAYDNYLMHYRTKGSKNGYTKDPDYTPVGEKAVAKKVMRDKIDRLAEENKGKYQYYNYRYPAGYYPDWGQIDKLSKQKSRGDYAGMPSSALAAKERVSELSRLSNQASRGDYAGMPTSAKEAQARVKEERNKRILAKYEINQLSKQAARGDLGGMPSSAREAKEKANRASEISRLNAQRVRGDYAGMPSSALKAKENTQSARIEEAKARYQKLNAPIAMKRQAEAKRKAEYMKRQAEANRLNTTYEKSKRYREAYNSRVKPNYDAIEEMKGRAEAKRLNSPYEKSKREQAANENRERELLLAENKRRQRVSQKEKKRAEEIERNNAAKSERDRTVKDWEDIVGLNKSNSALRSSNGYESRLMKEKKRAAKMTGKSPKDLRREKRDALLKKYGITPFSNGKWRKV